jgi:Cellulase (glycosyl hydrolase family 5)
MNEPRRSRVGGRVLTPAWGTGSATDIAAMYTAAGNLIHEVSPEVLIICEGTGFAADLTGVARHPVRLEHPGKVVYSLHDYSWFHPPGQPRSAYFDQMHRAGGYILTRDIAPLWIGEFGNDTRSVDNFGRAASPAAGWWNNVEASLHRDHRRWQAPGGATGLGMRCHTTRSRPRPARGWRARVSRTPPAGAR